MSVTPALMVKIQSYEKDGYTPDEIVKGLATTQNFPDVAAKVNDYLSKGYGADEILSGIKSSPVQAQQSQQEPGFLSRVSTDLGNRVSGAWKDLTEPSPDPNYPTRLPERLLRAGGQVAGGILDVPTEAVKSAYRTLVPEESRQVFSDFVKPGVEAISPAIQYLTQKAKEYPNLAKDAEAVMNIAGAVPMVKGATSLIKGVIPYGKDLAAIGKEAITGPQDIPVLTKKIVEIGTKKGIQPTNLGRNPKVTQKLYDDISTGSQAIVKNKGDIVLNGEKGVVPTTLGETLDAIEQSKKIELDKFLSTQQVAGEGGAVVKPQGLVDELLKMAEADKGEAQHAAKFAQSELPAYATKTDDGSWIAKSFTPQEAQANVAQLNSILNPYFNGKRSFEELSHTGVKLTIRDQMASALNDAVESIVGPGHQEFKDTWGALKNMEGQITHRFNVDARKASGGFFDLTTPFTAAKVISGLASKDPITLSAAAGMYLAKWRLKSINQPNRYIKGMFEGLDNLNQQGLRNTSFFADRSLYPPEFTPQIMPVTSGWNESIGTPINNRLTTSGMLPDEIQQAMNYVRSNAGQPMAGRVQAGPTIQPPPEPIRSGIGGQNPMIGTPVLPYPNVEPARLTVGPGPPSGVVGQGPLSRILTQIPNRVSKNNPFDNWMNPQGGK